MGQPWTLGIDAGTNSIGWAAFRLIENTRPGHTAAERLIPGRLLDGGVRLFDWGRDPQSKFSLNRERGLKRRNRRRLRAKVWRRERLRDLLASRGLVPPPERELHEVWAWRGRAARGPLVASELAAVLLHMARHRGFKSGALAAQADELNAEQKNELNSWEAAERELRDQIRLGNWTTVGEALAARLTSGGDGFVRARRGKGEAPTRKLIAEELVAIQSMQQPHACLTDADWLTIEDLILDQRPLREPTIGRCTVNPTEEERLPKAMPSAQRFLVRQTLCNLRLVTGVASASAPLTPGQFHALAEILDQGGRHSWVGLREHISLKRKAKFTIEIERGIGQGRSASQSVDGDQTTRLLAPLIPRWADMTLTERDATVSHLLSHRRNRRHLLLIADEWGVGEPDALADAVQFGLPRGHLAFGARAVAQALEYLEPGVPVHEAFVRAFGRNPAEKARPERLDRLPYYGEILVGRVLGGTSNPGDPIEKRFGQLGNITVHIALNELRKVVNALIHRYGRPRRIVIEMARELKANTKQLNELRAEQAENEKNNNKIDKQFGDEERILVSRKERLRRWKLAVRQGNVCPYTGTCMPTARGPAGGRGDDDAAAPKGRLDILTAAYQVDHIIPLSRGGTDVLDNLVLCVAGANAEKTNKTPWEAWHDKPNWPGILAWLAKLPKRTRDALEWRFGSEAMQRIGDDDEGWAPRQIRDTSYLARCAMEYLGCVTEEVVATKGGPTGYLRAAWGLRKDRSDHRHHFIDACVIGVTSRSHIQYINRLHARGPLPKPPSECGLDEPYLDFGAEVMARHEGIIPSLRPDHSVPGVNGALHQETLLAAMPKLRDARAGEHVRLATRRTPDELFKTKGKPKSEKEVEAALSSFRSDRFRQRFQQAIERMVMDHPGKSRAELALIAADHSCWGPRGISAVSCWIDTKLHDQKDIVAVHRSVNGGSQHRAVVETGGNARLEIRGNATKWQGRVLTRFEAAQSGLPDSRDSELMFVLRQDDIVSFELNGSLELAFVKKMRKDSGRFFVWPLVLAVTEKAASLRSDLPRLWPDALGFSAETFRKAKGRKVTISILGRLRDPGPHRV